MRAGGFVCSLSISLVFSLQAPFVYSLYALGCPAGVFLLSNISCPLPIQKCLLLDAPT